MPMQTDARGTGSLCVLRRNRPPGEVPDELIEPSKGRESKAARSNEWRNAYRRLSFILEPFKRRAKSADPVALQNDPNIPSYRSDQRVTSIKSNGNPKDHDNKNELTENKVLISSTHDQIYPNTDLNSVKDTVYNTNFSCAVRSTLIAQPNLISVCSRSDEKSSKISYVSPVNITGQIFEHYRRTRYATNVYGPRTELDVKANHANCDQDSRITKVGSIPVISRPASFHPVLPQRDESGRAGSHYNPYKYQNLCSSSESNSQNYTPPHISIPYQTFCPLSALTKTQSEQRKSVVHDSLYDYPSPISPLPCPTHRLASRDQGQVDVRAPFSVNLIRKRMSRPASIDPFLTFTPTSATTGSGGEINSRHHTHSIDRCGPSSAISIQYMQRDKPALTTTMTTLTTKHTNVLNSRYNDGRSTNDSKIPTSLFHPIVYPNSMRPQSGDSSSAICQVTVCHSAPKLCATVAENATCLQRKEQLSLISRPRSTLLAASEPIRLTSRSDNRTRPESYLTNSRGPTNIPCSIYSPLNRGVPTDLKCAVCSSDRSSMQQHRGRESGRSSNSVTICASNSAHKTSQTASVNKYFSTTGDVGVHKLNGYFDCSVGCRCDAPTVTLATSNSAEPLLSGMDDHLRGRMSPIFWNSIPEGNRRSLLFNGISNTHPVDRNSWSSQRQHINGHGLCEPDSVAISRSTMTSSMHTSMAQGHGPPTGQITRPSSVFLVPEAVCLPPPVGARVNVSQRVSLNTATTSTTGENSCLSTIAVCSGEANCHAESARRIRTSTVPGIRPPRPPIRTTSLVRGVDMKSRDTSGTPPRDSGISVHNEQTKRSERHPISVGDDLQTQAIPNELTTLVANSTTSSTPGTSLPDQGGDSRDKLADSEVEQAVGGPDSVWWLSLLPYKPSNLPTNLADRLRQRNSLVLARCSPSARLSNSSLPTPLPYLSHPTHQVTGIGSRLTAVNGGSGPSQTAMLMTQSLYEQRDTADQMYAPSNPQLSPADPATPHGSRHDLHAPRMSSRFRLPTRPSSLYLDKPDPPVVFMPSLAHLSGLGCSSSSGETGLSRCTWDRHTSASHANQSDDSSPVPRTSPSLSGDSIPISMLSSYNAAHIPPIEAIASKGWSVDKTDSPLLGQYCRLLNLRADHNSTSSNNNNYISDGLGTSATPVDLPTPSAETPLTPV